MPGTNEASQPPTSRASENGRRIRQRKRLAAISGTGPWWSQVEDEPDVHGAVRSDEQRQHAKGSEDSGGTTFIHDKVDEYREKYRTDCDLRNSDAGGEDEESHRNRREMEENPDTVPYALFVNYGRVFSRRNARCIRAGSSDYVALSQLTSIFSPFPISGINHCLSSSGSGTKSSRIELGSRKGHTARSSSQLSAYRPERSNATRNCTHSPALSGTPPLPSLPHVTRLGLLKMQIQIDGSANASAKLSTLTSTAVIRSWPGSPADASLPASRSESRFIHVNAKSETNSAEHDFAVNTSALALISRVASMDLGLRGVARQELRAARRPDTSFGLQPIRHREAPPPRRSSSQSQTQRQDAVRAWNIGTGEEEADGRRQHQHHTKDNFKSPSQARGTRSRAGGARHARRGAPGGASRDVEVLRTAYREVSLRASAPVGRRPLLFSLRESARGDRTLESARAVLGVAPRCWGWELAGAGIGQGCVGVG
ncbi:hypothetical protein C8Q74DRAFT_1401916 [Fomes fomentarius]|nr:hypothetical protein C8Q74DRAFT_1401916 [Fomes fomentarius]